MEENYILIRLGERIRQIRQSRKMTQNKLAVKSGIQETMLSRIESGQLNPTVRTLQKLGLAFEVELVEFFKP